MNDPVLRGAPTSLATMALRTVKNSKLRLSLASDGNAHTVFQENASTNCPVEWRGRKDRQAGSVSRIIVLLVQKKTQSKWIWWNGSCSALTSSTARRSFKFNVCFCRNWQACFEICNVLRTGTAWSLLSPECTTRNAVWINEDVKVRVADHRKILCNCFGHAPYECTPQKKVWVNAFGTARCFLQ